MNIGDRIRREGDISARPGQYDDLYDIADEVDQMVYISWDGLMEILDTIYPADVFNGSSEDAGSIICVLLRQIAALRQAP